MSMKNKKWRRRAIITACVICAVVSLCFALSALFIRAPEIGGSVRGGEDEPDGKLSQGGHEQSAPPVENPDKENGAQEGTGEKEPEPVGGDRREGVYTILLIGTSDDYSTDTIMVGTIDTVGKSVHVLGIPRDTKVEASRSIKKINAALGTGGIKLLKKEIASVVGFTPDFYIKVGLKGLISLVDAIGGIDFDIPYKMNYDDPTQDLHIHFEPGLQHLDGQAAMEIVRYRGHAGSDLSRMKIQQDFLMVVAKKMLTPANITKINTYAKIYAENVETDLTVGNIIWFALRGYEIGTDNINMATLPTYTKDPDVNPYYYQFVDSKKAIELINATINPFKSEITSENVIHVPFVAPASAPAGDDASVTDEGVTIVHVDLSDQSSSGETGSGEESSGENPGDETGDNAGSDPGSNAGENPEEGVGEEAGENVGE